MLHAHKSRGRYNVNSSSSSCVRGQDLTLQDIFETHPLGNDLTTHIVLVNFMIDLPWLCEQCPSLLRTPSLTVLHGDGGEACKQVAKERTRMGLFTSLHSPALPLPWGTHHSKIVLLLYTNCVRVCIRTFNDIFADIKEKSNALYVQDFPKAVPATVGRDDFGDDFARQLDRYFRACGGFDPALLLAYDFSNAAVAIVSSVPGYHKETELLEWGHLRLRKLLRLHAKGRPLSQADHLGKEQGVVCQASSFGTFSKKWLDEFAATLSTTADAHGKLPQPKLSFVAPTVSQVRDSIEGWVSSASLFIKAATVSAWPKLWRRWGPSQDDDSWDIRTKQRASAMPHLKTLCRYAHEEGQAGQAALLWLYVGSHNMSKSAWGELQKGGSQICVRSYEMGVVYFPSRSAALEPDPVKAGFFLRLTCTNRSQGAVYVSAGHRRLESASVSGVRSLPMVFPITLPPSPPPGLDDPTWSRDLPQQTYRGFDRFGTQFGERGPEFYGHRAVVQRAKERVSKHRCCRNRRLQSC